MPQETVAEGYEFTAGTDRILALFCPTPIMQGERAGNAMAGGAAI